MRIILMCSCTFFRDCKCCNYVTGFRVFVRNLFVLATIICRRDRKLQKRDCVKKRYIYVF